MQKYTIISVTNWTHKFKDSLIFLLKEYCITHTVGAKIQCKISAPNNVDISGAILNVKRASDM